MAGGAALGGAAGGWRVGWAARGFVGDWSTDVGVGDDEHSIGVGCVSAAAARSAMLFGGKQGRVLFPVEPMVRHGRGKLSVDKLGSTEKPEARAGWGLTKSCDGVCPKCAICASTPARVGRVKTVTNNG